jgi:4-hydroxy-2-oxoheptanedioate aldolase
MAARWTTLIVQIETCAGMEHLDEIAAVPGVDALLIGTGDLRLSMGIPLKETPKEIEEAIQRVGRTAREHGKYAGLICTPEEIPLRREQGYSFFTMSISVALISDPMEKLLKKARRYAE